MEKMWMRSVLVLAVCLSVACGKSKDGGSISKAPAVPKKTNTTVSKAPEASPAKADAQQNPEVNRGLKTADKKETSQAPAANVGAADHSAGNSGEAKKIEAKEKANKKTSELSLEEMLAEANRYSGAAEDSLRDLLTYKQMQSDDKKKLRNVKLAHSIREARMTQDVSTGQMKIRLQLEDGGKSKTVELSGKRTTLGTVEMESDVKSVKATLTCMDQAANLQSECETSVAEISSKGAVAQIIFRHTALALNAIFPNQSCLSAECEELYNFFRYTERKISDKNTLKSAVMDSSEVILGRSAFAVTVVSNDEQVMKMAAPLANPMLWPTLNTPVDRTLTTEDWIDPDTREIRKNRMNESLNDVRLISNDGHGRLNLVVNMKMREDGRRDTFQLRLERMVKPIVSTMEAATEHAP